MALLSYFLPWIKNRTKTEFQGFRKILNMPKFRWFFKVYSIVSATILLVGVAGYGVYKYGANTVHSVEIIGDDQLRISFNNYVLWEVGKSSVLPYHPYSVICNGYTKAIGERSFCVTKSITIMGHIQFLPGFLYRLNLDNLRTLSGVWYELVFETVVVPENVVSVQKVPFDLSAEIIDEHFVFGGVSDMTAINIVTNPEVDYQEGEVKGGFVSFVPCAPEAGYNFGDDYSYRVYRWEEIAVGKDKMSYVRDFCREYECPFLVDEVNMVVRTGRTLVGRGTFHVPLPIEIVTTSPAEASKYVHINTPIEIEFSKPVLGASLVESVRLYTVPVNYTVVSGSTLVAQETGGLFATEEAVFSQGADLVPVSVVLDGNRLEIIPEAGTLEHDQNYVLEIGDSVHAPDGGKLLNPFSLSFETIGSVKVLSYAPANNATKLGIDTKIKATFDQEVNRKSAESKFSISPNAEGSFAWSGNTMVFTPKGLDLSRKYAVSIGSGVESVHGTPSKEATTFSFTTTNKKVVSLGKSVQGRSVNAHIFGSGSKTVLYVGALHGSEKTSARIIQSWIDYLESNPGEVPSNVRIIVVAVANPDGYFRSVRFNSNGVDLNRNFGTSDWEQDTFFRSSLIVGGGGSEPFSEPEARILRDLIVNYGINILVDYHCCIGGVYSGDTSHVSSNGLAAKYRDATGYQLGADGWSEYQVTGSMTTWAVESRGVTAVTVEVLAGDSFARNLPGLKTARDY